MERNNLEGRKAERNNLEGREVERKLLEWMVGTTKAKNRRVVLSSKLREELSR